MKTIQAKLSLEHHNYCFVLDIEPQMDDVIEIPIWGHGIVIGINDNYQDTGQTWVMVKWSDHEGHYQYILKDN